MIEYPPNDAPRVQPDEPSLVEFVDGPWAGRREPMSDPPTLIKADGGVYRRSVRCADDGALRFVFVAGSGGDRPSSNSTTSRWARGRSVP
jgi:hypothetical protein